MGWPPLAVYHRGPTHRGFRFFNLADGRIPNGDVLQQVKNRTSSASSLLQEASALVDNFRQTP